MKIKNFVFCFVLILLIGIVSAQAQGLGISKLNNCVAVLQSCSNCTTCTISNIVLPDKTKLDINLVMETSDSLNYNYTFCQATQTGQYIVNGYCDIDGINTPFPYDFEVTATGQDMSTSKGILYVVVFFLSILIFIGLIIGGIKIPSNNNSDEMTGFVIAVSNLKYLKFFCIALSYLFLIFIMYLSWMISFAYLDMNFVSGIFQFLFYFLLICLIVLFPLSIFIVISNLIRDKKIAEMLSRGLKVHD